MELGSTLTRTFAFVLLTVVATGCGSSVASGDGTGGGGGDDGTGGSVAGCGDAPAADFCSNGGTPVCTDAGWKCGVDASSTSGSTSTGQVETCPDWAPPPDTACMTEGLTCEVDSGVDCGPETVTIVCTDGVWVQITARCQPTPCLVYDTAETCQASGCRWAEPGCGASPLEVAGCFEPGDCTVDGCVFGTCTQVSVLPACATEEPLCDSCGEDVSLCIDTPMGQGGGMP